MREAFGEFQHLLKQKRYRDAAGLRLLLDLCCLRFLIFLCFVVVLLTNAPHRPIATETLFEHAKEHRDFSVHVVVYPHFRLAGMARNSVSNRASSNPSPLYRPAASIAESFWMPVRSVCVFVSGIHSEPNAPRHARLP